MAASASDAHPYPIYNARFRAVFPLLDADGDLVTSPTTPDTELSQDCGTFADATNEMTEIASGSGMFYIDLIATELDTKSTALIAKSATAGMKTTPMVFYPVRLPVIRTGTAQAGGASSITLDSSASAIDDYYIGCYVNITNNSPSNALGQARMITAYVGSTKVATVEGTYGTNPSSASTFEVLATERWVYRFGDVKALLGTAWLTPGTAGTPDVNAKLLGATTQTGRDIGASVLLSSGTGTGQLSFTSGIAKVDVDTIKTNAVVNGGTITFPSNATLASTTNITAGTITTVTTVTNQLTAAAIATGVWQDATAGDFTTASSIGKALYIANVAPGASGGHMISGSNAGTTTFGAFTVTGATTLTGALSATNASNDLRGILLQATQSGVTIPTVTTVTNQLTAAAIATGVWTDTTAGDFTTALSVGKSVMNGVTLGTGLTVARVTLADTLTTYTGNTVQTGDTYALANGSNGFSAVWNRIGAPVGASISADVAGKMATYTQPTGFLAATFPATVASTTNITAGTLTTVTNLTTNNDKTGYSLSVTPPTAAAIADAVWDEAQADHVSAGTFGIYLDAKVSEAGGGGLTVQDIVDGIWDEAIAGHLDAGSTGLALNSAGSAGDPWSTLQPGAYAAGTFGYLISTTYGTQFSNILAKTNTIGNGTMTVVSPVSEDGLTAEIVRGDDYLHADGRSLSFTFSGVPSLVGGTVTFTTVNSDSWAMTVLSASSVYLERTAAQTALLSIGAMAFEVDAVLANGHKLRLGKGLLTVVDQL